VNGSSGLLAQRELSHDEGRTWIRHGTVKKCTPIRRHLIKIQTHDFCFILLMRARIMFGLLYMYMIGVKLTRVDIKTGK
jgi:hypothetical protein